MSADLNCGLNRVTKLNFPSISSLAVFLLSSLLFPLTRFPPGFPSGPGLTPVPADGQLGGTDGSEDVRGACFESTSPKSRLTHVCELLVGARFLVFTLSLVAACLIRLRCLCDGITLSKSRKPAHTRIRHQKSPFLIQRSFTGRIGHTHPSFAPPLSALIFYLEKDDLNLYKETTVHPFFENGFFIRRNIVGDNQKASVLCNCNLFWSHFSSSTGMVTPITAQWKRILNCHRRGSVAAWLSR